jgi:tRNA modification GTPase
LAVNLDQTPELVAEEFRSAATALGRITGEIDAEDLLESIFSSFCIGK